MQNKGPMEQDYFVKRKQERLQNEPWIEVRVREDVLCYVTDTLNRMGDHGIVGAVLEPYEAHEEFIAAVNTAFEERKDPFLKLCEKVHDFLIENDFSPFHLPKIEEFGACKGGFYLVKQIQVLGEGLKIFKKSYASYLQERYITNKVNS